MTYDEFVGLWLNARMAQRIHANSVREGTEASQAASLLDWSWSEAMGRWGSVDGEAATWEINSARNLANAEAMIRGMRHGR